MIQRLAKSVPFIFSKCRKKNPKLTSLSIFKVKVDKEKINLRNGIKVFNNFFLIKNDEGFHKNNKEINCLNLSNIMKKFRTRKFCKKMSVLNFWLIITSTDLINNKPNKT